MRLSWVELRDFRNHAHTELREIPDGLIVAVGPNGEGKTNLLEGMYVLYALGTPRAGSSEPLVRDGAEAGYARGEFETLGGRVLVEVEVRRRGANRVQVNRSPVRRKRDLRRQVRAVLFGPFDLPVVIGDPAKRRGFLDEAIVALQPAHDTLSSSYDRVLRQRNRLLKEGAGPGAPPDLEAWDEQLVTAGAALIEARSSAVHALAPFAREEFEHLAGYRLDVRYAPNVAAGASSGTSRPELEDAFRAQLRSRRDDELQRRASLVGPHRDDLELVVRELGARSAGSHGETWAAALCLRLGLAGAVERELGEPPLLLVDDPYSALDPRRRDRIGERLAARAGTVVISVADEADVPARAVAVWDVQAGTVQARARTGGG
ncbi:MAG TPA: DNA replication and repair protein RecF [Actinomycetota bacterium]